MSQSNKNDQISEHMFLISVKTNRNKAEHTVTINRVDLDSDVQEKFGNDLNNQRQKFFKGREVIPYCGTYNVNSKEVFALNYNMDNMIICAIENPDSVPEFKFKPEKIAHVKGAFYGRFEENEEGEKVFFISFQTVTKSTFLSKRKVYLFKENKLKESKLKGLQIPGTLTARYEKGVLYFHNYQRTKAILPFIEEFHEEANREELNTFIMHDLFKLENLPDDTSVADARSNYLKSHINIYHRKSIKRITVNKILEDNTFEEITKIANELNVPIKTKEDKIVLPDKKKELSILISFLDCRVYKAPFLDETRISNSDRTLA